MCGTPLPHRPITAPGAQSTLNFTRVPVDLQQTGRERTASGPDRGTAVLETPAAPGHGAPTSEPAPAKDARPPRSPSAPVPPADQPKELVPDVPLDEYVQRFRYEPPQEPAEVTMRGETPVARGDARTPTPAAGKPEAPPTAAPAVRPADNILASSSAAEVKPPVGAAPVAPMDVDTRLGLEPESAAEARIARPRFLDVNQPLKETPPAVPAGPTTIGGPSFLGLSDAPPAASEARIADDQPRTSHWRAWFAVAVVLVLVGLGLLEWRAQRNQTDNGPVEVIRAKIHNLRYGATPQNGQAAPAEPAGSDANAKPEMQVQEQPKPAATGSANPGSAAQPATAPTGNQSSPSSTASGQAPQNNVAAPAASAAAQNNSAAAQNPPATSAQNNPTPTPPPSKKAASDNASSTQSAAAAKPKPKRAAEDADEQPSADREAVPGAEEMAKAKDASDSAAAAAWLWKATAKGNPDAPVQLANMYIRGDGVPRSCEQALVLLKTAAEKENAPARNRLASMYATGSCVQRDRVEAYRWLSSALAADPNSQWAQQNRELIWLQMTPDERAAAEKYR